MRLLVCGGRDFNDWEWMNEVLTWISGSNHIEVLIHGAARGADSLAGEWAELANVPIKAYPADWQRHGRAAGPIRNRLMLSDGKPDFVIAFPGGRGTADMISAARVAGVTVMEADNVFTVA